MQTSISAQLSSASEERISVFPTVEDLAKPPSQPDPRATTSISQVTTMENPSLNGLDHELLGDSVRKFLEQGAAAVSPTGQAANQRRTSLAI